MVTIISKSDGPRRDDVAAKRFIEQNRSTITRLADHLTQGAYSANRAAEQARVLVEPPSAGGGRAPVSIDNPVPYVKLSPNGRVLLVDLNTARQLEFLGEVRRRDGRSAFVLASAANGFISALDEDTAARLADLDGMLAEGREGSEALKHEIARKLGLA
ncbi:hypothetical protein DLJ53_07525 [Acuticoccus sediminis]|uniref:Uncharacterized protein n=1 Tax=Acuticoccus sediminis TaxID=2184697 RepID=A0A8B2P2W2_9HYPH|nr:hypothetical protein [Acuticoccus sediminis]RAI04284.1 hypothetical protein DLJ53_07525 [Acuticoccus sediminis]